LRLEQAQVDSEFSESSASSAAAIDAMRDSMRTLRQNLRLSSRRSSFASTVTRTKYSHLLMMWEFQNIHRFHFSGTVYRLCRIPNGNEQSLRPRYPKLRFEVPPKTPSNSDGECKKAEELRCRCLSRREIEIERMDRQRLTRHV
jgi:hypothetical protein